jgi:hypothetical protein
MPHFVQVRRHHRGSSMEPHREPATLAEFVAMLETHLLSHGWIKNPHPEVPRRYKKVTDSFGPHPRGDFDVFTSVSIPENCRLGPDTYGGSKHDVTLLSEIYQGRTDKPEWLWKFDAQSFSPVDWGSGPREYQVFVLGRYVFPEASFATFHEFYEHMLAKIEEKSQPRK